MFLPATVVWGLRCEVRLRKETFLYRFFCEAIEDFTFIDKILPYCISSLELLSLRSGFWSLGYYRLIVASVRYVATNYNALVFNLTL